MYSPVYTARPHVDNLSMNRLTFSTPTVSNASRPKRKERLRGTFAEFAEPPWKAGCFSEPPGQRRPPSIHLGRPNVPSPIETFHGDIARTRGYGLFTEEGDLHQPVCFFATPDKCGDRPATLAESGRAHGARRLESGCASPGEPCCA